MDGCVLVVGVVLLIFPLDYFLQMSWEDRLSSISLCGGEAWQPQAPAAALEFAVSIQNVIAHGEDSPGLQEFAHAYGDGMQR